MIRDIRNAGFRVMLVPLAVIVGTFAMTALAGLFLPLGVKNSVAASAGFGWYSLAPPAGPLLPECIGHRLPLQHHARAVLHCGRAYCGPEAGLHRSGGLPGATAMDTVLPVVVSATDERMTIYSFASGMVLSLAVPVLVPAIVSLPF